MYVLDERSAEPRRAREAKPRHAAVRGFGSGGGTTSETDSCESPHRVIPGCVRGRPLGRRPSEHVAGKSPLRPDVGSVIGASRRRCLSGLGAFRGGTARKRFFAFRASLPAQDFSSRRRQPRSFPCRFRRHVGTAQSSRSPLGSLQSCPKLARYQNSDICSRRWAAGLLFNARGLRPLPGSWSRYSIRRATHRSRPRAQRIPSNATARRVGRHRPPEFGDWPLTSRATAQDFLWKDVRHWEDVNVQSWLASLGLSKHGELFKGIKGKVSGLDSQLCLKLPKMMYACRSLGTPGPIPLQQGTFFPPCAFSCRADVCRCARPC